MNQNTNYQWSVIGAGPAGIAAVGKLLDSGISPEQIMWVDPYFHVGDLGRLWPNVPSNTKVKLFLKFLNNCYSFQYDQHSTQFLLNSLDPELTCDLRHVVEPLQSVTDQFLQTVSIRRAVVENLVMVSRRWHLQGDNVNLFANNVILAVGAEPKKLAYSSPIMIPMEIAMDQAKLISACDDHDVVAVFGSSHSAILVLRNLIKANVKKIINFYRSPLRYAVFFDDWILFDNTGLKGKTAEWARENLVGQLPENLIRAYSNQENIEHHLPQCNKVVYATGFERRKKPIITEIGHLEYVPEVGIIAPGLFGLGIAFPEKIIDRVGVEEYRVGLWKFMDYLNRILPIWLRYSA